MSNQSLPKKDRRASSAFTMIEMMVVVGMLAILMGVAFSGLGQARARARVAKANAEVRELLNALLAYESSHDAIDIEKLSGYNEKLGVAANKETIGFLLNEDRDPKERVYLNAQLHPSGELRDPWGKPYTFRVMARKLDSDATTVSAAVTFPNRQRYMR